MKKKGYTLVELVAVIGILSILLGSGFTIVKTIDHMKAEVELEDIVYKVMNILSYSKAYCRKNYYEGYVKIGTTEKKIIFLYIKNGKEVIDKTIKIPKDITVKCDINSIKIGNDGFIKNSCTIEIHHKGNTYHITVAVGLDTITFKGKV